MSETLLKDSSRSLCDLGSQTFPLYQLERTRTGWGSGCGRNVIYSFPGGSVVKNVPAMLETWVQSLGWEDPLEKEMATQSSIIAWEIPWTEGPDGLQSMGLQKY